MKHEQFNVQDVMFKFVPYYILVVEKILFSFLKSLLYDYCYNIDIYNNWII